MILNILQQHQPEPARAASQSREPNTLNLIDISCHHLVVKNIPRGVGQEVEDSRLQVRQLLLVLGHSQEELRLPLLNVRPLFRYNLFAPPPPGRGRPPEQKT